MPDSKLTVFISYVHEDSEICDALNNALQSAFGEKVKVFVDRKSIEAGESIRQAILVSLADADILVVISTGTDRPSHDWTGLEIGYFIRAHEQLKTDRPLWGKIVTLCSAGKQPRTETGILGIVIDLPSSVLDKTQEEYDGTIRVEDTDPMLLWFGELHKALYGTILDDNAAARDRCRRIIVEMKKRIFAVYKGRPKIVLRPQKQLVVRYNSAAGTPVGQSIPDDASVTFRGGAAAVFGIQQDLDDRTITWQEFRNSISENLYAMLWTVSIERVLNIGSDSSFADFDRGLIASSNQVQLYRLLLTTPQPISMR